MNAPFKSSHAGQHGAGIVETMIGILIGMLVVLVIYNVFALAERHKRDALGAADAQSTGLYAQFVLAREIANGGNGISSAMNNLFKCTNPALRPIPVLITDGGANVSDSVQVFYSTASRVMWPVYFVGSSTSALYPAMTTPTSPFFVQSPNGFRQNDQVLVIGNPTAAAGASPCMITSVTNVPVPDVSGVVSISHSATGIYDPNVAKLLNLGAGADAVQQTLFDVNNGQLRSTNQLAAVPVANPIAQNVVLLKAQYGVDCQNNGVISWTSATNNNVCTDPIPGTAGISTPTAVTTYIVPAVQAFDKLALRRIRAIRIAIVVRSDEPDLKNTTTLIGQTKVLFDCSTHNAACQGSITLNNAVLTDGYRFRSYETVIPLRNPIWNWEPVIT